MAVTSQKFNMPKYANQSKCRSIINAKNCLEELVGVLGPVLGPKGGCNNLAMYENIFVFEDKLHQL